MFGNDVFQGNWTTQKQLVFDRRPMESWQGMPLGTGWTGAMAWASNLVNLQFTYRDHWASDGNLLSILRLKIEMDHPIEDIRSFRQVLYLEEGKIELSYQTDSGVVLVTVYAHREEDIFEILIEDDRAEADHVRVIPEFWRPNVQPVVRKDGLYFVEENGPSSFAELNRHTGSEIGYDHLKNWVHGIGIRMVRGHILGALCPSYRSTRKRFQRILISGMSNTYFTVKETIQRLARSLREASNLPTYKMAKQDKRWWKAYWDKSFVEVQPESPFLPIQATWYLHRFFCACSMEGYTVPKFNGSLFLFEYDRRYWGGAYWFQNTRLMYWPLLKTGDHAYMTPFFDMYYKALEYAQNRVKNCYQHGGAIFLETMHAWGAGRREDVKDGKVINPYIQNYFGGSLELLKMMLEYHRYQQEKAFASKILEMAFPIIRFFSEHFPRKDGKLFLSHSAALETWWDVDQPADQIAGLWSVLPDLIRLADVHGANRTSVFFKEMLSILPPLPRGCMRYEHAQISDPLPGRCFVPAERHYHTKKENYEDPELYAIWPYALLGIGKPDYEDAMATFHARIHKAPKYGWSQTAIWAARLGLSQEAMDLLLEHFRCSARFPGGMMVSPGYSLGGAEGITDCAYFDAPGAISIAWMEMLLQEHNQKPVPFAAWPKDHAVAFRLHLPSGPQEFGHQASSCQT